MIEGVVLLFLLTLMFGVKGRGIGEEIIHQRVIVNL